jgi:hypothetical protein
VLALRDGARGGRLGVRSDAHLRAEERRPERNSHQRQTDRPRRTFPPDSEVTMRLLLAALALAAVLSPGAAATAEAHGAVARPMHRPQPTAAVRVSLESDDGMALPTAMHHGATFVAGEMGRRYAIRVDNDSADRIEVVVAVDGRDAVSGKMADARRQRGYVVQPFGSVVIDGFRRSHDHVAAFRFTDVEDSFSGRMGTGAQAGIITVAVFREKQSMRPMKQIARGSAPSAKTESRRSADAGAAPKSAAPSASSMHRDHGMGGEKLGTQFGETMVSRVVEVPFVRRVHERPDQRVVLQYDSAERLVARGVPIDFAIARPVQLDDRSWPSARTDDRFTAPPPRR